MSDSRRRGNWQTRRAFLRLVGPLIVAGLSEITLGIADTAIVGRFSVRALAAVAVGAAIAAMVIHVVAALSIAIQIMVPRTLGADRQSDAAAYAVTGLLMVVGVGTILAVICVVLPGQLVGFLSDDPETARGAASYLRLRAFGFVFFAGSLAIRAWYDSQRATGIGMRAAILANSVNVSLTLILVHGSGPLPPLGAEGSAIASAAASAVSFLYLLNAGRDHQRLPLEIRRASGAKALKLVRLSLPEVANAVMDYGGNLVFVAILATMGAEGLAGGHIAFSVLFVVFAVAMAFGMGLQISIGRSLGSLGLAGAMSEFKTLVRLVVVMFALVGGVLYAGADLAASVFTREPLVLEGVVPAIRIISVSAIAVSTAVATTAALRALGKTATVFAINAGAVWFVQLPAAWLLVRSGKGLWGAYLAFSLYFVARLVAGGAALHLAVRRSHRASAEMASA